MVIYEIVLVSNILFFTSYGHIFHIWKCHICTYMIIIFKNVYIYIYIYIYMCVCVCVYVCAKLFCTFINNNIWMYILML